MGFPAVAMMEQIGGLAAAGQERREAGLRATAVPDVPLW
jgi:hypothetical protein